MSGLKQALRSGSMNGIAGDAGRFGWGEMEDGLLLRPWN